MSQIFEFFLWPLKIIVTVYDAIGYPIKEPYRIWPPTWYVRTICSPADGSYTYGNGDIYLPILTLVLLSIFVSLFHWPRGKFLKLAVVYFGAGLTFSLVRLISNLIYPTPSFCWGGF